MKKERRIEGREEGGRLKMGEDKKEWEEGKIKVVRGKDRRRR